MAEGVTEPIEANGPVRVPQVAVYVIVALLSYGANSLVGYFRDAAADQDKRSNLAADVRVLQEQVSALRTQVNEMRSDVRTLLERGK